MSLPTAKLFLTAPYESIDSGVGNPNFPGPSDIYNIFADSKDRIWGSTVLPIWVFFAEETGPILNPYGENRDVANVGDRGEFYSFVERIPGEVWGGAYSAEDHVVKLSPIRSGTTYSGVNRGWRPKGKTTDGTYTWWCGNDGDTLGRFVRVDANGSGTLYQDIINQVPLTADYFSGTLYVGGSGEGISGATVAPKFYSIDPADMSVNWTVNLAGSRPLSMLRISSTEYLVICHLSSDTVPRVVLVDISVPERRWTQIQPSVRIFGRARNSLLLWEGEYWTIADDGFYVVDIDNMKMVKRANFPTTVTQLGSMVSSERYGLLACADTHIFRYDPR